MSQNPYEPVQQPDNNGAPQDPYAATPPSTDFSQPYGESPQQPFAQPEQPAQPYGQAPQQPYGQPQQFGQVQQPYGQPQQPGYQQPGQPYGNPVGMSADNGFGNLQLNLWLSAFFNVIPALIFWIVDKDKTTGAVRKANADNLSWQLVALIAMVVSSISIALFIGIILYPLVSIGWFVISIINAIQVPGKIRAGQQAKFLMTPEWIK